MTIELSHMLFFLNILIQLLICFVVSGSFLQLYHIKKNEGSFEYKVLTDICEVEKNSDLKQKLIITLTDGHRLNLLIPLFWVI